MTAKEIAYKATVVPPQVETVLYMFTAEELQAYADALCEEQRSACLEAYEDTWKSESILTAPQPEAL